MSISQPLTAAEVNYFHLEFDSQRMIYAEGAATESFVDDESREMFDNAREYNALYPDAMRSPHDFARRESIRELQGVREKLTRRTLGDDLAAPPAISSAPPQRHIELGMTANRH